MKTSAADSAKPLSGTVVIPAGVVRLVGDLEVPAHARGLVLFAHGSGSSRHSPRNQFVAQVIRQAGLGTLLLDLLTQEEEREDNVTGALRFDVQLLAQRLIAVTSWLQHQPETSPLKLGYFGASTGGAAALIAAATLGSEIGAVVSRGGRPDLAGDTLPLVRSPTLLIVGGHDHTVLALNQEALACLRCDKRLSIVPGATHLFEEPGALEQVARLSTQWFNQQLGGDV